IRHSYPLLLLEVDTNEEGRLTFRPNGHDLLAYVYFLSATKKTELEKLGHVASLIKGGGIGTGWNSTHITGKTLQCPDHSSDPSVYDQCCSCPGARHLWALQGLLPTRCTDPTTPALRVSA